MIPKELENHPQIVALKEKMAEESLKTAEEMSKRAKYKIQIWFKSDRSLQKPVAYSLSAWESGKRLHGGGDEMMFICRRQPGAPKITPFEVANVSNKRKNLTETGCGGLIPGEMVMGSSVVCPHCHIHHDPAHIGDSIFYRTNMTKASEIVTIWWRHLACDADIYVKFQPNDPRTIMMSRAYSARTAREKKGLTIYPLANILKDTAHGASVESRFKALFTS